MDIKKPIATSDNQASFTQLIDLAAAKLGGKVLYSTDDFFAEKENLIKAGNAIFIADKYTDRGKWMDGWESRRKRVPGHDWCILQLATAGRIHGFDIDTSHFLGNHPPHATIEALHLSPEECPDNWVEETLAWQEILPRSPLDPGNHHYYACASDEIFTHLKLHIFPDGGVARLRVYGEVVKEQGEDLIDLAAAREGGKAIACNDMFFSAMDNLIMPGRGINMGDGWETKRNRTPNNRDWVILRLACPGKVEEIEVDTKHFKGNYPDSCSIEACFAEDDAAVLSDTVEWHEIVGPQKLNADHQHFYRAEIQDHSVVSHIRLNIFPDGGISRLRILGKKG